MVHQQTEQISDNGTQAQKFEIVSNGDGYYYILTGASNYTRAVDIENGSAADGTNVIQWDYWGGTMQMYKIVKNSDGSFAFLTRASNEKSALEVYEISKDAGANVDQWTYFGGNWQHWKLTETN
ncbi:RICIN domain-containing protein [Anaerosporobacter sp.]|uniref:RICIN domain-containing protein n=1 Tax=Anaerosporobacter sp. TaxID=1872529 RepID=UPI00286F364D|nr:RICIN domain-containing protein [Anaerosporobacter sp.]